MSKINLKNLKLTKEEQDIEKALAAGEFVRNSNFKKNKKLFEEAVKEFRLLRQTKRITIRVNQKDLLKVKAKAKKGGIGYQTLLNLLIRQYAEGISKLKL